MRVRVVPVERSSASSVVPETRRCGRVAAASTMMALETDRNLQKMGQQASLLLIQRQVSALQLECGNWSCSTVPNCVSYDDATDDLGVAWWLLLVHSVTRIGFGMLLLALRRWVTDHKNRIDLSQLKCARLECAQLECAGVKCVPSAAAMRSHLKGLLPNLGQTFEVFFNRVMVPLWWVFLYMWAGALVMEALEAPGEVAAHNQYAFLWLPFSGCLSSLPKACDCSAWPRFL